MTDIPRVPWNRLYATFQLVQDPFGMWPPLRARYGKTFRLRAWNGDIVCTADPEVLRDLFKATSDQVRPFAIDGLRPLIGAHSVLLLAGAPHRAARRLLTPPFHGARMRAYTARMREIALRAAASWGDEIVAADQMLSISLEVIARAVFGVEDPARVGRITETVGALARDLRPELLFVPALLRLPVGPGPRFLRTKARFDAQLAEVIAERRAGRRGEDVLSMLIDATHEDGTAATDDEIRDQLVTLLFAGHETTQIAMAWMLYHLAGHPAALARLQAEVDRWDGASDSLDRLPWLDAVVKETLRLNAIVPGDPELYPDPDAFAPERHLERSYKPHELIPFGGGVRRCIGAALATWEMKVVVATLVQRFDFARRSAEVAVRRNATAGPRYGVRLALTPRRAAAAA
jgi:cytochrome P450 family 110